MTGVNSAFDKGCGHHGSNNVVGVLVLFILLVIIACAGFW
ncbi:YjcZ family sporulation protein [Paenibacillus sp. PL2-23]